VAFAAASLLEEFRKQVRVLAECWELAADNDTDRLTAVVAYAYDVVSKVWSEEDA
jgi:hypothetical protein